MRTVDAATRRWGNGWPAGVGIGYLVPDDPDGIPLFAWDMGPDDTPTDGCFRWDQEHCGWDEANWCPEPEYFTLDSDEPGEGLDAGIWALPDGSVPDSHVYAPPYVPPPPDPSDPYAAYFAGWDIGYWARIVYARDLAQQGDMAFCTDIRR